MIMVADRWPKYASGAKWRDGDGGLDSNEEDDSGDHDGDDGGDHDSDDGCGGSQVAELGKWRQVNPNWQQWLLIAITGTE